MSANKKLPNPIDVHVGSRVKLRRTTLGISQEKLGESLGITFQQIQKYEKGSNRIGASRLQKISETLRTPVAYFFEHAPETPPTAGLKEGDRAEYVPEVVVSPEGLQLTRAFMRIPDPEVRRRVIELINSLGRPDDDDAPKTR